MLVHRGQSEKTDDRAAGTQSRIVGDTEAGARITMHESIKLMIKETRQPMRPTWPNSTRSRVLSPTTILLWAISSVCLPLCALILLRHA